MDKLKHFHILSREGEEMDLRGISRGGCRKEAFRPYFADALRRPSMASRRAAHVCGSAASSSVS